MLYRAELVPSSDEAENLDECKELLGWLRLSTYFRERPPVDKIYVFLVQTPKGKSIYCGDLSNLQRLRSSTANDRPVRH